MELRDAEHYALEYERMMREFMRHGRKHAMADDAPPRSQFFLMSVLQDGGPRRTTDLAAALDISSPAVTGLVNELVHAGFIRRTEDERDRRVTVIDLTPEGRAVLERVQKNRRRKAVEILRHFERHEIDQFLQTLEKMHRLLREIKL